MLECVRQAEKKLIEEAKNMEYLPTQGDNEYKLKCTSGVREGRRRRERDCGSSDIIGHGRVSLVRGVHRSI